MKDYLKEFCTKFKIKLVYTNNKLTILSSTAQDGIPTLRVHNIFKNCPENIAKAIIDYYTNFQDNNISFTEIDAYAKENYSDEQYKIKPPEDIFKQSLTNVILPLPPDNHDESNRVEYNIISIIQKDFLGNVTTLKADEIIVPSSENVLELNIVISPKK